jgi:hypothetical protein
MIEKESFVFIVVLFVFALLFIAQVLFLGKIVRNDKKNAI